MTPTHTAATDGLRLTCYADQDAARADAESALVASGFALPLPYIADAAAACDVPASYLFVVHDAWGECRGGFLLADRPQTSLPGHRVSDALRFGVALDNTVLESVLAALVARVRLDSRLLRFTVSVFEGAPTRRARLESALVAQGFLPSTQQKPYLRTLRVSLARDDDAIFAGFHSSVRRNVREVEKRPVRIEPLSDRAFVPRMEALFAETLRRTGGRLRPRDWAQHMALSERSPDRSRLIGVVRTDVSGPDALVAFAWGCHHGDHATYAESASTRVSDMRIAVAYPMLWDLIRWANRTGASWFDLGGVTLGTATDGDAFGGISDFKRFFSQEVVELGGTWVLPAHTLRARLAQWVHRAMDGTASLAAGADAR